MVGSNHGGGDWGERGTELLGDNGKLLSLVVLFYSGPPGLPGPAGAPGSPGHMVSHYPSSSTHANSIHPSAQPGV